MNLILKVDDMLWPGDNKLTESKFQNACLQGYLFSQKLNKDTPF